MYQLQTRVRFYIQCQKVDTQVHGHKTKHGCNFHYYLEDHHCLGGSIELLAKAKLRKTVSSALIIVMTLLHPNSEQMGDKESAYRKEKQKANVFEEILAFRGKTYISPRGSTIHISPRQTVLQYTTSGIASAFAPAWKLCYCVRRAALILSESRDPPRLSSCHVKFTISICQLHSCVTLQNILILLYLNSFRRVTYSSHFIC